MSASLGQSGVTPRLDAIEARLDAIEARLDAVYSNYSPLTADQIKSLDDLRMWQAPAEVHKTKPLHQG